MHVAGGGRLVKSKRFDLMIDAFADVAAKYPDWVLRIYGGGPDRERLQGLIEDRELGGQVTLMGARSPISTMTVTHSPTAGPHRRAENLSLRQARISYCLLASRTLRTAVTIF